MQKAIKHSQPTTTTNALGYHEENATKNIDDAISLINLPPSDGDKALYAAKNLDELADQKTQQHLANISLFAHQNQSTMTQIQTLMSTITDL